MQPTRLTPVRRISAATLLPKPSRHASLSCRSLATPSALTDIENQALGAYRSVAFGNSASDAIQVLKRAAATKSVQPEIVEGALLTVEQLAAQNTSRSTSSIAGRWRLVFATGTKFRPFQYIPLKEDFVLDESTKTLVLESSIGPFEFFVRGVMSSWRPEVGDLDFQFNKVDIYFSGNKVWEVNPKTKPKTYTFFHVGTDLACARSSTGGVALLVK
ncbi:hypothetical protein Vretimale_17190 [Volvox reticuliferus]|uniref:Plastid lipid-associated protein/fibrillin conserved domain-containing protein n=1 Tax=Volvox reticuliferus TaxID=1737510 RepID=A0A8J4GW19_9CHLO|nr:hypothetical protein Vretifemale_16642 [Volvox reticuliferus]GIM14308.1 hypothetical protein Vretimale_17190 [Volvox reticuliferus]